MLHYVISPETAFRFVGLSIEITATPDVSSLFRTIRPPVNDLRKRSYSVSVAIALLQHLKAKKNKKCFAISLTGMVFVYFLDESKYKLETLSLN